jgi:hypothetical protein
VGVLIEKGCPAGKPTITPKLGPLRPWAVEDPNTTVLGRKIEGWIDLGFSKLLNTDEISS